MASENPGKSAKLSHAAKALIDNLQKHRDDVDKMIKNRDTDLMPRAFRDYEFSDAELAIWLQSTDDEQIKS